MLSTPAIPEDRYHILDILRGFALLGIFVANCAVFSLYVFLTDDQRTSLPTSSVDLPLAFLGIALVEGKFYSMFSLLFGVGFTIILHRNQKAGRNGLVIFYRRLLVLAALGLLHALLLWDGDILLLYALIGMFLPFFRKITDRNLLVLAVLLIFSPLLMDLFKVISQGSWNLAKPFETIAISIDAKNGITESNFRTWLVDHENYDSIVKFSQGGFFWRYQFILDSNRIPKVLAMFLLGMVAGRNKMFERLEEFKPLLKKLLRIGLWVGLPASLIFAYLEVDKFQLPHPIGLLDTLFYALSVVPLSLAYVSGICLIYLRNQEHSLLMKLVPAGRMALTNYLLQSVLAILIFYGVGLGLGASVGPSVYLPIAIAGYFFLLVFSSIWLRYFRFGPFEWIWRQLTYWKWFPLRRSAG